jgi:formylglycine-generating enzyme required for sulfatase activity/4-amino-4-deoxy-L-arabinose transferase-like glycosyltransferase
MPITVPKSNPSPTLGRLWAGIFIALAITAGAGAVFVRQVGVPFLAGHMPPEKLIPGFWRVVDLACLMPVYTGVFALVGMGLALWIPVEKWSRGFLLAAVFLLAMLARLTTPDMALDTVPRPDGAHYSAMSSSILTHGSPLVPIGTVRVPSGYMPGTSLILCLTQWLHPTHLGWGIWMIWFCTGLTIWLVYRICKQVFSAPVGIVGALLLAVSPAYGYYSTELMSEIPWSLLVLLTFYLVIREPQSAGRYFWAGVLTGLGMLFKVPHAAIIAAVGLSVALGVWRTRFASLRPSLCCLFGVVLGVIPFLLYNWAYLGHWLATPYHLYWPQWASVSTAFDFRYLLIPPSAAGRVENGMGNLPYYLLTLLGLDPRPERMPLVAPLAVLTIVALFIGRPWRSLSRSGRRFLLLTALTTVLFGGPFFLYSFQDVRFFLPILPPLFMVAAVPLAAVTEVWSRALQNLVLSVMIVALAAIACSIAHVQVSKKYIHERVLWERMAKAACDFDVLVSDEDPVILTHYGVWNTRTTLVPLLLPDELWFSPDPKQTLVTEGVLVKPFAGTVPLVTEKVEQGRRVAVWIRRPFARRSAYAQFQKAFATRPRPEYGVPGLCEIASRKSITAGVATGLVASVTHSAAGQAPGPPPSQSVPSPTAGGTTSANLVFFQPPGFSLGGEMPMDVTASTRSRPVHTIRVSPFSLARCEVTTTSYAEFLNEAWQRGSLRVTTNDAGDAVVAMALPDGVTPPLCRIDTNGAETHLTLGAAVSPAPFGTFTREGVDMGDHPMVCVSWYGAAIYCNWISQKAGLPSSYVVATNVDWPLVDGKRGFRLPTEAEWEVAATLSSTSGLKRTYAFGNDWTPEKANVAGSPKSLAPVVGPRTEPVTAHPDGATPEGLLNMTGNVWEWCQDWFSDYPQERTRDPIGPAAGTIKIVRGGSFRTHQEAGWAAFRGIADPAFCLPDIGFRVARGRNGNEASFAK